MKNIFTDHPHSLGESYFQHMKYALQFGTKMAFGGIACIIHAIFPFVFKKTASNHLLELTHEFIERMPRAEDRVVRIAKAVEQKVCKASNC